MSIGRAARLGGTGGTSVQQTQAPELPSPLLRLHLPRPPCLHLTLSLSLSRYFETPPSIGNPPPPFSVHWTSLVVGEFSLSRSLFPRFRYRFFGSARFRPWPPPLAR